MSRSGTQSPLVIQVIPHRTSLREETQGLHTLETIIQTLATGDEVIGLEIAHTERGPQFLLRATSEPTLHQMMRQLQARYPQATVRRLTEGEDPLVIGEHDHATVVELCAGGEAYQSLRSWSSRDLQSPGADPMLSLLAQGKCLPPSFRMVAQLALEPLPPGWARNYARLALEHPLEEERQRRREMTLRARRGNDPGWGAIIALGCLVILLTAWKYWHLERFLPSWVLPALGEVLHGHMPSLTGEQRWQVLLALLMIGLLIAGVIGVSHLCYRMFNGTPRVYDQRRVAEKLSKSAYRGRLRLYIIETITPSPPKTLPVRSEWSERALSGLITWADKSKVGQTKWFLWFYRISRALLLLVGVQSIVHHAQYVFLQAINYWQASNKRRRQHRELQTALVAAYQQYHTSAAYFRVRHYAARQVRRWLQDTEGRYCWSEGMRRATLYLSAEEVALLWHPLSGDTLSETPQIEQRQERSLLAPHAVTTGAGWKLGTSEHAGIQADVFFPFSELRKHTFVVGRTGKGKSTLFEHLALAQLHDPVSPSAGLCIVEPHGDLISALLRIIPDTRIDEVTLVDLSNQSSPVGLNLLDVRLFWNNTDQDAGEMDLLVSAILTTLKGIWAASWGSRIENMMRYALKALMEANLTLVRRDSQQGPAQQYTLLDVVPFLNLQAFRRRVLDQVGDPFVLEWWHTYYERLDTIHQNDLITPIITKISAYASTATTRRIIGQPCSTIDPGHIVEHGGILLVNTAAGMVGRDVSSLLGATLLSTFSTALARQLSRPEQDRRRFLALVDEFRNYPVDYGYLLSELRKAGLSLVLAAQSLAQLDAFDPMLRPTVLGNSDHLFVFTLAGEDAALLRKELGLVQPEDVVALPDYTCYARWSLQGKRLPIFSFRLALPSTGDAAREAQIRQRSAQRDGRAQAQIDALMQQVHRLHYPERSGRSRDTSMRGGAAGSTSPISATGTQDASLKPKRVRTRQKGVGAQTDASPSVRAGSSQSLLQEEQQRTRQQESTFPLK